MRSEASLIALARLVRVEYCTLGAIGVLLGAFLITGGAPDVAVLWSAAAVFFVATACYSLDDVSDLSCDRINRRMDRPLVTGAVQPRTAMVVGVLSFLLAAVAALLAGTPASVLIGAGAIVAIAYNRWLQGSFPLKNVLFASVFPVPLLVGWLASGGSLQPLFMYCIGLVFIAGLGFETMIDVADREGDLRCGVVTFATRFGTQTSVRVASAFFIAAGIVVMLLYFLPVDSRLQGNVVFLSLAVVSGLSFAMISVSLLRNHSLLRIFVLKRWAYATFNAGVLAILLGVTVTLM